jgi:hypothetical protein
MCTGTNYEGIQVRLSWGPVSWSLKPMTNQTTGTIFGGPLMHFTTATRWSTAMLKPCDNPVKCARRKWRRSRPQSRAWKIWKYGVMWGSHLKFQGTSWWRNDVPVGEMELHDHVRREVGDPSPSEYNGQNTRLASMGRAYTRPSLRGRPTCYHIPCRRATGKEVEWFRISDCTSSFYLLRAWNCTFLALTPLA